jgi:hypothetical protein
VEPPALLLEPVAPPALLVAPVEPAPVDPAPLADPPLLLPGEVVEPVALLPEPVLPAPALPELEPAPEPMRALVSMKVPLPVVRDVLEVEPAVPLVPVAPGVLPPPCRQPVTVTVRLAPAPWLAVVEPDCADMLTAQPSAIANVAPVHTLFIPIPPQKTRNVFVQSQRHSWFSAKLTNHSGHSPIQLG